jgi:RNA polymerase sigma factor (sigma-70 family)
MEHSDRLDLFEKARTRHSVFLTSVLWKLTGDKELFTEAMQYALLRMWQHVQKLNSNEARSYLYRIALTASSMAWRNRIRRNGDVPHDLVGAEDPPEENLATRELAAIVRRQISRLPKKQARAIVMRYFQQQDYRAIAQSLRCTEAGARSNVSRALATLKCKLGVSS